MHTCTYTRTQTWSVTQVWSRVHRLIPVRVSLTPVSGRLANANNLIYIITLLFADVQCLNRTALISLSNIGAQYNRISFKRYLSCRKRKKNWRARNYDAVYNSLSTTPFLERVVRFGWIWDESSNMRVRLVSSLLI